MYDFADIHFDEAKGEVNIDCDEVDGQIWVDRIEAKDLSKLSRIKKVINTFQIKYGENLTTLAGLNINLEANDLYLNGYIGTDLEGLSSGMIMENLIIENCPNILDLRGFPEKLKNFGSLIISENDSLLNLTGLDSFLLSFM